MNRGRAARATLVLAAFLLAACGGATETAGDATPAMPACAPSEAAVAAPAELPASFPLPPGTVLNLVRRSSAGATVIGGVVPLSLSDAVGYFIDEMPGAGFELGRGDAEQDEAEAAFSGVDVDGQWKVHSILDCADAVTLTLAIIRR